MDSATVQREEWGLLYRELLAVLPAHGREDPFGNGDYWLVDDNYSSTQHKICATRPSFVTRPMVKAVQRLLQGRRLHWEVLVSLDFKDAKRHPDDLGILVSAHRIDENWNRERMRKTYGNDFQWDLRSVDD